MYCDDTTNLSHPHPSIKQEDFSIRLNCLTEQRLTDERLVDGAHRLFALR